MADPIVLDYGNMMAPRLSAGRGLEPAALAAAADRFAEHHREVERERESGRLGFFSLTEQPEVVARIRDYEARSRGEFDDLVVLGIGGSALGTTAVRRALLHPFWNELPAAERDGRPRLHVLDNIDPSTTAALLERLDFGRTLVNVVSKSGTTAETMAQFLVLLNRVRSAVADGVDRHFVFTTDPERGPLRDLGRERGIETFAIPPNVGGRFSVMTPVGLLPAALCGIGIEALLDGAEAMAQRCASPELRSNPAGLFATLQYLADTEHGAPIHVMMAYSDRLYAAADWFRQLWAESLGKRLDRAGREVCVGPTPVHSLGATDQHSQVQLYMEGPFDKTVTFLAVRDPGTDVTITAPEPAIAGLEYLAGGSLADLLEKERLATATALARHGRMNMTLELPAATAHAMGQFFMLLQIATVYAGMLYHVDPLDQPGVELGKRITRALMGEATEERLDVPDPDPRWVNG